MRIALYQCTLPLDVPGNLERLQHQAWRLPPRRRPRARRCS
jgi:hypothetical protein